MSTNTYPLPLSTSTPKLGTQTSSKIAWEDKNSPIITREQQLALSHEVRNI